MIFPRTRRPLVLAFVFLVLASTAGSRIAQGQLRWPSRKKQEMHLRLVAMAVSLPRSTFYSAHEVFVAEKEVGDEEWSLVKLVYQFLPYQPRLSEIGFDYSRVHELRAVRDPACDETLAQMPPPGESEGDDLTPRFRYSTNSPLVDLERRRTPLPCYQTSAEDYGKSIREPAAVPEPSLRERR